MTPLRLSVLSILLLSVAGCSALPGSGPSRIAAQSGPEDVSADGYLVVDIDEHVVSSLRSRADPSLTSLSDYKAASAPVIGIGDVIRVTLWEAAPGNLFTTVSTAGANTIGSVGGTTIPDQVVPRTGTINVPFAGDIRAVGKQAREVEKSIVERLRNKAVDPQVLVNVIKSTDNSVTVAGDAVAGGQVQLGPNNERILEAIAVTGGIRTPVHDTFVSLTRGAKVITVPYMTLTSSPAENIRLSPRDVVFLYAHKRTYTVFGAAGHNAEVAFDAPTVTLAQAVARVGGLDDDKADATGVYVFRFESPGVVPLLAPDKPVSGASRLPVIYRLNLRDPKGLFFAQSFHMREGDTIYVSNAAGAEFTKFLRILGTVVAPAVSGATIYNVAK